MEHLKCDQRGQNGGNGDHQARRLEGTSSIAEVGSRLRCRQGRGTSWSGVGGNGSDRDAGCTGGVSSGSGQKSLKGLRWEVEGRGSSGQCGACIEVLDTGVLGQERTIVDDVGSKTLMVFGLDLGNVEVIAPSVSGGASGLGMDCVPGVGEVGVLLGPLGHHHLDGRVGTISSLLGVD